MRNQLIHDYNCTMKEKIEHKNIYREDGSLKENYFLINGLIHGPWRIYNFRGDQIEEKNYLYGKLNGIHRKWIHNNRFLSILKYEGMYLNGFKEGRHKSWSYRVITYDGDQNMNVEEIKHCLITDIKYKKDKFHGVHKEFYSHSNQVKYYRSYDNGVSDKVFLMYYLSGKIMKEIHYVKGNYHGTFKLFNESGQVEIERNYKNGLQHGLNKTWNEKGQLISEFNNIEGLQHGLNRTWNQKGQLLEEISYSKGIPDLDGVKRYYDNGQIKKIKLIEFYEDGKMKDGFCRQGLRDLYYEGEYINGLKQGEHIAVCLRNGYGESGLMSKVNYKNGEKNGLSESWKPDGLLESQGYYSNGVKNGLFIYWFTGFDDLSSYGVYRKGLKDGVHKSWDQISGKLISSEIWRNGEIIKKILN